jgi:hypothetical protein
MTARPSVGGSSRTRVALGTERIQLVRTEVDASDNVVHKRAERTSRRRRWRPTN